MWPIALCRKQLFGPSLYFRNARNYSTEKPSIKLVAELRKLTEVSIVKAREALSASNNDVNGALEWLKQDLLASGEKKAAKVQDRHTGEGLVGVAVLSPGVTASQSGGVRAAMIELNCETDFVGRNALFGSLVADIAHTAAFLAEPSATDSHFSPLPVEILQDAPLLSSQNPNPSPDSTVSRAIRDLIAKVGENVVLRRAVTVVRPPPSTLTVGYRTPFYMHNSINDPTQGRIGVLGLLQLASPHLHESFQDPTFVGELERIERSLARQIAGFETRSVRGPEGAEDALYNQPFMIPGDMSGQPVGKVLEAWSKTQKMDTVDLHAFAKWTIGESLA
ncbi:unnamed protein product [Mycena citricolor]|uniref:Elongation factor Ts, mitochondrial n=1 Tax=Mycena citricolor TaxID=2018698 RepID=A0AAD2Q124_9AGAR|nr:unnamed protein product [Mycena citricolor]CAK5264445.1 unnamed protein product [Mycena citricolor]